jgi:Arc/MetJ-type ribon-helix-helix transcriptional regulator
LRCDTLVVTLLSPEIKKRPQSENAANCNGRPSLNGGHPCQTKTWNTRKDAEAWARQVESEIDRGIYVSRAEIERTTVGDLLDRYRVEELPKQRGHGAAGALKSLDRALGAYAIAALTSRLSDLKLSRSNGGQFTLQVQNGCLVTKVSAFKKCYN